MVTLSLHRSLCHELPNYYRVFGGTSRVVGVRGSSAPRISFQCTCGEAKIDFVACGPQSPT